MNPTSGGFLSFRQHAEGQQPLLSGALTLRQGAKSPKGLPGSSHCGRADKISLMVPAGQCLAGSGRTRSDPLALSHPSWASLICVHGVQDVALLCSPICSI